MKLGLLIATTFVSSSLFSGMLMAQQGELIVSPTYIKPGCSGWVFMEGGYVGSTGEPQYPYTYQTFAVSCNGDYVVRKTQLFYKNGNVYSCNINLINATAYTLSSNSCTSFEVRSLEATPSLPVPATPGYAYMGKVNGCGTFVNGAVCPAPEYWAVWPNMADASSYQYQFAGTQTYSGSTTATSITIPYGYNPSSGQVRACNVNNQCSGWRVVTVSP